MLQDVREVSPEHASAILRAVDAEDAKAARELLQYDEDTAGGLMQKEFISIPRGLTARDVVKRLRESAQEYRTFPSSYLYVLDEEGRLEGVVSLRKLVLCDGETRIRDFLINRPRTVPPEMPGSELVRMFRRYHFLVMPVVDARGVMLGVVTQDDAMRYAEEEADEELLRFSGIVGGEELRSMPLSFRFRRRLSWLSVSLGLNLCAASVILYYQDTVKRVIALAVFLPILGGMSGSSGNQAVAVSIRELSLNRIKPRNLLDVLWQEAAVGLINGLVLGLLIAAVAYGWWGNPALGLVVGGALWVNTVLAVCLGGTVPLALHWLGKDPAIASGPILTTITDLSVFLFTLGLATYFLPYL